MAATGYALVHHRHRLDQIGGKGPVDDEARGAAGRGRQLADDADKGSCARHDFGIDPVMADDLHQVEPRHGIEEMDADQPLGMA